MIFVPTKSLMNNLVKKTKKHKIKWFIPTLLLKHLKRASEAWSVCRALNKEQRQWSSQSCGRFTSHASTSCLKQHICLALGAVKQGSTINPYTRTHQPLYNVSIFKTHLLDWKYNPTPFSQSMFINMYSELIPFVVISYRF